jgi:hypothetical protein
VRNQRCSLFSKSREAVVALFILALVMESPVAAQGPLRRLLSRIRCKDSAACAQCCDPCQVRVEPLFNLEICFDIQDFCRINAVGSVPVQSHGLTPTCYMRVQPASEPCYVCDGTNMCPANMNGWIASNSVSLVNGQHQIGFPAVTGDPADPRRVPCSGQVRICFVVCYAGQPCLSESYTTSPTQYCNTKPKIPCRICN